MAGRRLDPAGSAGGQLDQVDVVSVPAALPLAAALLVAVAGVTPRAHGRSWQLLSR